MDSLKQKLIASSIGAIVLTFFSPVLPLLKAAAALVIIDMLTGMVSARFYKGEDISSRKFFQKIFQLGVFAVGLTAFIFADEAMTTFGADEHYAAKAYCAAYIIYELISILENLGTMNLPIAKQMVGLLKAKLPKELQENKAE